MMTAILLGWVVRCGIVAGKPTRGYRRCPRFEIYLGGLHKYRAGRPSLSCDVIEPLRVPTVDRWVVNTCGQGELTPAHFVREEGGGYRLQPAAFGRALYLWEKAWQDSNGDGILSQWVATLGAFVRERSQELPDEPDDPGDL